MRKQNGAIKLTPGISGYAQINGRVCVSPEEKANLDGYYYEHISLWLDIKIFVITIVISGNSSLINYSVIFFLYLNK